MMRCCLRDMLVDENDDLLATLIVIRSGRRNQLEEDEAMLHCNKDLLLGESYLNTFQGGLDKMFTSHGGGARGGAHANDRCVSCLGTPLTHPRPKSAVMMMAGAFCMALHLISSSSRSWSLGFSPSIGVVTTYVLKKCVD